jgi:hypothetical protein
MSNMFPPPEGWREARPGELRGEDYFTVIHTAPGGKETRISFVRKAPVPPLPIAPYTVIRVTWKPGRDGAVKETYALSHSLNMWTNVNTGAQHSPRELFGGTAEWEVLSEPRAVTAKAVLDGVREQVHVSDFDWDVLQKQFGVTDD